MSESSLDKNGGFAKKRMRVKMKRKKKGCTIIGKAFPLIHWEYLWELSY